MKTNKDPDTIVDASPTSVLDAIGVGLLLVDDAGDVTTKNAIAEELLTRQVNDSTLHAFLVGLALTPAPEPSRSELARSPDGRRPSGSDQRKVDVTDHLGRRSVIGYRIVRSARLGTIFTLRDISEVEQFRAKQRQLERLSEVGKACAMVAHEIGNPLAAIKATIQSIEREAAIAGLQDPISAVYSEIHRLDKILSQLLGFVRHRPPRKTVSHLQSIVTKARNAAGSRLDGVQFTERYDDIEPIHVDPDQLEQVLINLFLNAADAQPSGGTLAVSAEIVAGRLLLRVEDEGPGIAAALRQQIFESFYTTKQTGTGLGLSICYRIITEHGGTIAAEERRDKRKGTCISILLPTKLVSAE